MRGKERAAEVGRGAKPATSCYGFDWRVGVVASETGEPRAFSALWAGLV